MTKTIPLALLFTLAIAGCASIQEPLTWPDLEATESLTVTLPDSSSFSSTAPETVQAAAALLAQNQSEWSKRWLNRSEQRYQVAFTLSSGEEIVYAVNNDSVTRQNGGKWTRTLSEAELRQLDQAVLGDDPYRRFPTLDFQYPSE